MQRAKDERSESTGNRNDVCARCKKIRADHQSIRGVPEEQYLFCYRVGDEKFMDEPVNYSC